MYILQQMKYAFSFVLKNKQNNITHEFFALFLSVSHYNIYDEIFERFRPRPPS